jgi:hypothetical protein
LIVLVLQLWALIAIDRAGITGWDDFAQWSLNAAFLWRHDLFPSAALSDSYSNFPGYPYAMPYLGYAASLLRGAFITQGGSMAAWLLLACFAWALSEMEVGADSGKAGAAEKLAWLALAILLATLFNPGFNPSFTITGQSDTPTAVLTGFIGLLLVRLHAAILREGDKGEVLALGAQIALAAAAMALARQMNVVLLGLLAAGFLVAALRFGFFWRALRAVAPALLPALLMRLVWQGYVDHASAHVSFAVLPLAAWHWNDLPQLIGSIGHEMLKKSGLFLLLLAVSFVGVRSLFRPPAPERVCAIITATVFFGYFAFLVMAYLGSGFSEVEIRRAASFYRYSTHVSLLGVIALWFALRPWIGRRLCNSRQYAVMAAVCLAILPVVYSIKPDVIVPQSRDALCRSRELGRSVVGALPANSGLAVVAPDSNSFETFIINYELALDDIRSNDNSRVISSFDQFSGLPLPDYLAKLQGNSRITSALVSKAGTADPAIRDLFGIRDADGTVLLFRNGSGCEKH